MPIAMLASIEIKNFALIDSLTLDFNAGLTVVTGETGAGKSIVIDALGLALGERADTSIIRFNTDKADISACFNLSDGSNALRWLQEQELDDDGECILRRVIAREGRSRCFINGRTVTLNMLKDLGDLLVDIHGQHAHQSLLKPKHQLALLDELLDSPDLLEQVKTLANQYKKVNKQLKRLTEDTAQRDEKTALLAYQLQELELLNLSDESIQQLEKDHAKSSNMQLLVESCQKAVFTLAESESDVLQGLDKSLEELNQLTAKDADLKPITELLQTASAVTHDAVAELRQYQDKLDVDQTYAEELEQQLGTLFDLSRKHRADISQLPKIESDIKSELDELNQQTANTTELDKQLESCQVKYDKLAKKLTKARKAAAKKLSQDVSQQMAELGMTGGQFNLQLHENNEGISIHGNEMAEFMVSANPGQPLQALTKVASGGEISRISLAIQVITAQKRVTPSLIFDEVDVGIGGQTADTVGRMLVDIAEHAQVICVTHQPQVAARGHQHLHAEKQTQKDSTETQMSLLTPEQRIEEIARMVGGKTITDSTIEHAKELLTD